MALDQYSDNERLGLAAYWADDAATKLAAALSAGLVHGTGGRCFQRGVPEAAQHAVHEIGVVHVHDRDPGQAGQYPDVRSGVLAGQAVEELAARSLFPRPPPDQRDLAVVAA